VKVSKLITHNIKG